MAIEGIHNCEQCGDEGLVVGEMGITRCTCGQAGNSPANPDCWISCSERMPEDGQHVIILCDGAFVLYAQYRDGEFFDIVRNGDEFFETQSRSVTDWMPLPEPPQEVNRG